MITLKHLKKHIVTWGYSLQHCKQLLNVLDFIVPTYNFLAIGYLKKIKIFASTLLIKLFYNHWL